MIYSVTYKTPSDEACIILDAKDRWEAFSKAGERLKKYPEVSILKAYMHMESPEYV